MSTNGQDRFDEENDCLARELEVALAERDEARLIVRHLVSVMDLDRAYLAGDAQLVWRLAKGRTKDWP